MGSKGGGRRGAGRRAAGGGGGAPKEEPKSPAEAAVGAGGAKEEFGPSNAKVEYSSFNELGKAETRRHANEVFGRNMSERDLASVVGAPDNATVQVSSPYAGAIRLKISGPNMSATRTIHRGSDGKVSIHNDIFTTREQNTGLGTQVFGRQVEQAAKLGVDRIETLAARSDGVFNGYYTWARFGYNAPIPPGVKARLPAGLRGSKDISDLMKSKEGREFWKAKGDSVDMTFDLKPGSLSRRTLDAYVQERKARGR